MKYIDLHCDTLMPFAADDNFNLYENKNMIDLQKLQKGDCMAQFFAMFMVNPEDWKKEMKTELLDDWEYMRRLKTGLDKMLREHGDLIAFAGNAEDMDRNRAEGKISAFLTIEDGRPVDGKIENLQRVYDMGVRLISLTWNYENSIGYPNSRDPKAMKLGLKPFGKEAVERMNELGILVDVSHLSDGGFYDVAAISRKPFVASHSNCRAVCPHPRNLTDEMIRILAEKGGVAGLNFCPPFLDPSEKDAVSKVDYMVAHIRHLENKGGIESVAIGTDFDGIGGPLELSDASMMPLLFDRLRKEGYKEDKIEKIAWKNAERVIRETL